MLVGSPIFSLQEETYNDTKGSETADLRSTRGIRKGAFDSLITGEEKWVHFHKPKRKIGNRKLANGHSTDTQFS